ncbi:hypothetical protein C8R43DRAFT_944884 [Mycena crocata]|nr:hypothetical protein C8R43DRAFT_944884 [Mycena crocata]
MSDTEISDFCPRPLSAEELKSRQHAEAQGRYRASKLEETRTKARERMARLRLNRSAEEIQGILQKCRGGDADYRELLQELSKHRDKEEEQHRKKKRRENTSKRHKAGNNPVIVPMKRANSTNEARSEGYTWENTHLQIINLCLVKALWFARMAPHRLCEPPFWPDSTNFKSVSEHGDNNHKFYFAVRDVRIYTLISDALVVEPVKKKVFTALAMDQTVEFMNAHCKAHHCHHHAVDDDVVPDSEVNSDEEQASSRRTPSPIKSVRATPILRSSKRVPVKAEELKHEVSASSPIKMLPLFLNDDEEDVADGDAQASSRKRSVPLFQNACEDTTPKRRHVSGSNSRHLADSAAPLPRPAAPSAAAPRALSSAPRSASVSYFGPDAFGSPSKDLGGGTSGVHHNESASASSTAGSSSQVNPLALTFLVSAKAVQEMGETETV